MTRPNPTGYPFNTTDRFILGHRDYLRSFHRAAPTCGIPDSRMFGWRRLGRWQVYHPRLKCALALDLDFVALSSEIPTESSTLLRWSRDRDALFNISGDLFLGIMDALRLPAPTLATQWLSWTSAVRRPAVSQSDRRCTRANRSCRSGGQEITIHAAMLLETIFDVPRFQHWFVDAVDRFAHANRLLDDDKELLADVARVANSRLDAISAQVFGMIDESAHHVAGLLANTWNRFPGFLLVRETMADAGFAPDSFRSMREALGP